MKTITRFTVVSVALTPLALGAQVARPCRMSPPPETIRMPASGLTWLRGEPLSGACDAVPPASWIRKPADKGVTLMVAPEGPEGSGRYWNITIGLAAQGSSTPDRGVCLMTSTAGWPILASFRDQPLPWIDDVDRDGRADVILWSNFPLRDDAVQMESGLIAWVYRVNATGTLTLDRTASRTMAGDIAEEYRRRPPTAGAMQFRAQRQMAAEELDAFAAGRCELPIR